MRLLFLGDNADSGFGTVTRALGSRLLKLGLDVRFVNMNGTPEPLPEPFADRTWDRDRIMAYDLANVLKKGFRDNWIPEACLLLADYQAARNLMRTCPEMEEALTVCPTWHYVPIEGEDLPSNWAGLWEILHPVAMSAFGAAQIERVIGVRPPLIYHGVDLEQFHRATPSNPIRLGDGHIIMSREQAKRVVGLDPSRTLLLRTDRFMPRKQYGAMLRSLAPLLAARPEVDIIIHCRAQDQGGDLADEISRLPVDVRPQIKLTNGHNTWRGYPTELLATLYNAADLYVSTSAEGFGLCLAESLACGTPVVGLDYSAVPEVVGKGGVCVPVGQRIDNVYAHYWATPDEDALRYAVHELITHSARRQALGDAGMAHVRMFDWDNAALLFAALLAGANREAIVSATQAVA